MDRYRPKMACVYEMAPRGGQEELEAALLSSLGASCSPFWAPRGALEEPRARLGAHNGLQEAPKRRQNQGSNPSWAPRGALGTENVDVYHVNKVKIENNIKPLKY